jgi:hypothetical protein
MNDQTDFEKIFESFRAKFPPAASLQEASLKISTKEINEMIEDFWPDPKLPPGGITQFMINQGYKYEPEEVNERIRYFWLIGSSAAE